MSSEQAFCIYLGDGLAHYHFGDAHPFGPRRYPAFVKALQAQPWSAGVKRQAPVQAGRTEIERFHSPEYVQRVRQQSAEGQGYLDYGDTPAVKAIYEAAATVVGAGLHAAASIMAGHIRRAFIPIAGLHHARRDAAAGFCVFNDCGVIIETLLADFQLDRVAYVDIDAHHGDGVYYGFEDNPAVIIADLHQDGRTLYPGTGRADETGTGDAKGTKLNIPMPPGASDAHFMDAWPRVEAFLQQHPPDFVLLQCGVDSLAGDPLTAMHYSPAAHAHAAQRLRQLAEQYCEGRLLAMGGGGYNLANIATGWTKVAESLQ